MNGFVLLLIIFHVVLGSRAIGQLSSVLNCPWTLGCSNCAVCDKTDGSNCGHNFGIMTDAKQPSGESSFLFTFTGLPSNGALNGIAITIARSNRLPLGDRNITDVGYGAALTIGGTNSTYLVNGEDWPYETIASAIYGNFSYLWGFNRITDYTKIRSSGLILNYEFKLTGDRSAPGNDSTPIKGKIDCIVAEIDYGVLIMTPTTKTTSKTVANTATTMTTNRVTMSPVPITTDRTSASLSTTTTRISSNPATTTTSRPSTTLAPSTLLTYLISTTTTSKTTTQTPITTTVSNLIGATTTDSSATTTITLFDCLSISNCTDGGKCISNNVCECFEDFVVDSTLGCRRKSNVVNCSHIANCSGGGRCVGEANEIGRCQCNDGFVDDNMLGCRFIEVATTFGTNVVSSVVIPVGAIIGIIIGCLLLIGGLIAAVVVFIKRNRNKSKTMHQYDVVPRGAEAQYGETKLASI